MKKLLLFLILSFPLQAHAQKDTDEINLHYDVSFGVLPLKLSSTSDVANNNSFPVYRRTDTTGLMLNFCVHLGTNLPSYRSEGWSVGAKLSAGVGIQGSLRAAEGLKSYTLDFPQYLYYRNYKYGPDISLMAGIKHTRAALNYTLPMVALSINRYNGGVMFYSSVKRDTYYSLYTNGEAMPLLKIGEHGMAIFYIFGSD